jgi:hypothetical protein
VRQIEIFCGQNLKPPGDRWSDPSGSIVPSTNRQSLETHRYTMLELYELRRIIIKHSRSIPPGPERNEHRQIANSMRSLSRDKLWLAVHTVDGLEQGSRC